MKINEAFPGSYLRACDLQDTDIELTMDRVEMEDIGGDHKPVLYFRGKEKGLVLNKTNGRMIGSLHGEETNDWGGKLIVIYPTRTQFRGEDVDCIRVRGVNKTAGEDNISF